MILGSLYLNEDLINIYKLNNEYEKIVNYILYLLRSGICKVSFEKKDGSLRNMVCTNNKNIIKLFIDTEFNEKKDSNTKDFVDYTATYSIDSSGFRTLKFDNLKYIELVSVDSIDRDLISEISDRKLKEIKNVHIQL